MACVLHLIFTLLIATTITSCAEDGHVTYDGRSLIINGQRKILFSGSIHYPRSTPEMWPSLISKAKEGGINVIQTYVFWNLHEPQRGQYDFSGRRDLVRFIKEVQAQGLYVSLRIGPFIEAEWTYGGLPVWLRDTPNIVFRSDNKPWKAQMQNFTTMIVNMMKAEKLYASQGGPIVLSQIENEYQNVEAAYHAGGVSYVKWAAAMAVGLQTGVPWMMCKGDDAPDPVINTCNGMRCDETFKGPNSPNKPAFWTEDWTSFLQVYGDQPYMRSAEDIAFHVAQFIANNKGSFINYYMYHGGTNFGRTGASYMITSYYDQAPLDEYGLLREPKWSHLKELHGAVQLSSDPLLQGVQKISSLGRFQQAYVFEAESGCAAFLVNYDYRREATVLFQGSSYTLPSKSISILPDCKTIAFNTAKVGAQYNTRSMVTSIKFDSEEQWKEFRDTVPGFDEKLSQSNRLLDQISTAKDASDYLWYTFTFQHSASETNPKLQVSSNAHVLHAFVNGDYVGSAHGSNKIPSHTLESPISLNDGANSISLLSVMVGLPDGGPFLERRTAGLQKVTVQTDRGSTDFTNYQWGYQVGLAGEKSQVFTDKGADGDTMWGDLTPSHQPLTWYKTTFDAPEGDDPIALNLASMGKGEAWVNGESIGRYWVSFLTAAGSPSQSWYHIPRSFLRPTGNTLVLLEEEGNVDPLRITIDRVTITRVCGRISHSSLPPVLSWKAQNYNETSARLDTHHGRRPKVQLQCPIKSYITNVVFASYGNPLGDCRSTPALGSCHSSNSLDIVKKACQGKRRCTIPLSRDVFRDDPCPGTTKSLLVEALCS